MQDRTILKSRSLGLLTRPWVPGNYGNEKAISDIRAQAQKKTLTFYISDLYREMRYMLLNLLVAVIFSFPTLTRNGSFVKPSLAIKYGFVLLAIKYDTKRQPFIN